MKAKKDDFIRILKSGHIVKGQVLVDHSKSQAAHRDFIQLIPKMYGVGRGQYRGALMSNVTISNNVMVSRAAQTQGIFASDGCFKKLKIENNFVHTLSQHKISICGFISGTIRGNENITMLYPMRIGGGGTKKQKPVAILSFNDAGMKYREPRGDGNFKDYRRTKQINSINLKNFRYKEYQLDSRHKDFRSVTKDVENMIKIALDYGDKA